MEVLKDGYKIASGPLVFLCKRCIMFLYRLSRINEHAIYLIYKLIWTLFTLHCPFCIKFLMS